jgi:hypothetical protein
MYESPNSIFTSNGNKTMALEESVAGVALHRFIQQQLADDTTHGAMRLREFDFIENFSSG